MAFFAKIEQYFRNFRDNFYKQVTSDEISLIKNTHLFDNLHESSFNKLLKSVKFLNFYPNEMIFKEGTTGNALYIIEEGSVIVFTVNKEGKKIHLARLDKGAYFGEQALMGHASESRNASIEAMNHHTKLIKVPGKFIREMLQQDFQLKNLIIKKGHEQLIHKIIESIPSYASIKTYFMSRKDDGVVKSYNKNEVIFYAQDTSDSAYIILHGAVKLTLPHAHGPKEITLVEGDLFGELGVLQQDLRAGTATAVTPSRLLCIEAKDFKKIYENSPEINQLVKTLKNTYSIPNRGLVLQFFGKIDGTSAITTTYKLPKGRTVLASSSTDGAFIMNEKDDSPSKKYKYTKENGTEIEIDVVGNIIKCVKCTGSWIYLKNVCAFILDQKPITEDLLKKFEATGVFRSSEIDQSEVVCICMSVPKDTIEELIEQGVTSLAAISNQTGACTVCGSCRPRVLAMLGQNVWMPALLKKVKQHNDQIASFVVQPIEGSFNASLPGEHLIIQLKIEGSWVERAYTISGHNDSNEYQITIKHEEGGLLSEWLHNHDTSQVHIFVSQPQGDFKLIVEELNPIVCFAGGIGITPFINFAKALKEKHKQRPMHLVYIVPTTSDFVFLDELEEIAKEMPNFQLTLWERKKLGYLTDDKISEFIKDYVGADIYICGPEGFETSLIKNLSNLDYRHDKIFVEKFTYTNTILPNI